MAPSIHLVSMKLSFPFLSTFIKKQKLKPDRGSYWLSGSFAATWYQYWQWLIPQPTLF